MAFTGDIFVKDIDLQTETLIEGNLWTLNCAIFSALTGDLHHGSAQYLIEGTRIAFTKYGYETKLNIFQDKTYAEFLNLCLLEVGLFTRRGDSDREYRSLDKRFLKFLPEFDEKYTNEEILKEVDNYKIFEIDNNLWKICTLYIIIDFLTRSNDIMSRMEVDPIGTLIFRLFKKFKPFLINKIEDYSGNYISHDTLFKEFLDLEENKEEKSFLNRYNKAKLVSYLDVESMVKLGEGYSIEFKKDPGNGKTLVRDSIAFANSDGGKILVGINDDGTASGVRDIKESMRRVIDYIRGNTVPKIRPDVYPSEYQGNPIVIVEIFSAEEVVYDTEEQCFIRIGEETRRPTKQELKDLFKKKGEM